jgi:hypothetical protein
MLLITSFTASFSQAELRVHPNKAFVAGEILKYRIHYGIIDAGVAQIEVKKDLHTLSNRKTFHVVGTGRTKGAFDWFFKVRDRYESYIDTASLVPWAFVRRVNEGGYIINQNVTFNHYENTATSEKGTIHVPEGVQDLVSAYYYARNVDMENAKVGDLFPINAYLDDEVFPMNLKFIGIEKIKIKLGTFECLKFRPMLQEGRVFKEEEDMTIWVSNDSNRLVVRAEANILVGSIKMDLKDYSGLAHPLSSKKK